MNADELLRRIIADGADAEGIRDRFGGNSALFAECFEEFLTEKHFDSLRDAIARGEHDRAFDAAHALKGLSANLGVTAFYADICALVEALRSGEYGQLDEQYASVARQREHLRVLCSEQAPSGDISAQENVAPAQADAAPEQADAAPEQSGDTPAPASAVPAAKQAAAKRRRGERGGNRILLLVSLFMIAILAVCWLFGTVGARFQDTLLSESGRHLTEMSDQIKLYVEEQVAIDWKIAVSVADSIAFGDYPDDEAVFNAMRRRQDVWQVSNLMLYTESGYCVYADGSVEKNDVASEAIVRARQKGRHMSVLNSTIIYTVPVQTTLTYKGSPIAAIGVVRSMRSFLDDMQFSSFDGEAWIYLTDANGILISHLTNPSAVSAFNFQSIVRGDTIRPLEEGLNAEDLFTAPSSAAFLLTGGAGRTYAVAVPVSTGDIPLRLYYMAPEQTVNSAMNTYSYQLTVFSIVIIALISILCGAVFLLLYRNRKRLFNRALHAREHMFDLLVQNTKTAFSLLIANRKEPVYVSSNIANVAGSAYLSLDGDENGYRLRGDADADSAVIAQANEALSGWDGKSVFRSGYIRNARNVPPTYFAFELYPVNDGSADFISILQDVTPIFEREEAAREAMHMATRANEAKSRFLSNISHDIRTPMNAIMNMTNFALESIDQPKKLGGYLHTIRESSEHLLRLINDVLEMSRIESGQIVLAAAPFDIRTEIGRQVDMVRPLCAAKEQTLLADFSGLSTRRVRGDALKLSQIIMNLLSNAVKFTPPKGAVRFTAKEIPSLRADIVNVRFVVEDNGIGISQKDVERIFDPFCRAQDKRVGHIEGTGLGLSICKNYVDAMGGSIRCESEEGEGSTFTVELFFTPEDDREDVWDAQEPGDTPFLGMRCLVAEDNAVNQIIARTLLERLGFRVDFSDDGSECLERFLSERPETYDVIYLDIHMPVMDGYQTVTAIRSGVHPRARTIPIVGMSANAFAEDIEKARAAGMDAYVSKPILSAQLVQQTRKAIHTIRS